MHKLPNLIVIRHGETQWNTVGRLQGHKDTPLTHEGVCQAQAVGVNLADRIASHQNIKFWCSPLPRALQTASILSDIWTVPFEAFTKHPLLKERCYGTWEGRTLEEVKKSQPDEFQAQDADPLGYAMPEGESRNDLNGRINQWLSELSAFDQNVTHVVVTHSGSLRALRAIYTKASIETMLAYCEPQTASFILCDGQETMLEIPTGILQALGCTGAGTTVRI